MSLNTPNPYASPDFTDKEVRSAPGHEVLSPAIIIQQRVLAVLLIVHGSLMLIVGFLLTGMAVMLPPLVAADMKRQGNVPPGMENMTLFMAITYGVMAACGILPGALQIYAGIRNLWLKGHTLGLVALGVAGVLSVGTCYCLPTGLAMLIYGLIIYLHQSTLAAFRLAKEGHSYKDILDAATHGRPLSKPPVPHHFAQ